MPDLPQFLYLLVDHPTLIVVPIVLFAAFAVWSRSRTAWVAAAAWDLYLIYELGMKAGEFCAGNACLKRTPLYVVYPLLAILSLLALVRGYVRVRDRRQAKRLAIDPRRKVHGAAPLAGPADDYGTRDPDLRVTGSPQPP